MRASSQQRIIGKGWRASTGFAPGCWLAGREQRTIRRKTVGQRGLMEKTGNSLMVSPTSLSICAVACCCCWASRVIRFQRRARLAHLSTPERRAYAILAWSIEIAPKGDWKGTRIFHRNAKRHESEGRPTSCPPDPKW